jgi:hypothetical protein
MSNNSITKNKLKMSYPQPQYSVIQAAKDLPTYTAESTDKILARQADGNLGYILVSDLQTTLDGEGLATDSALQALSASVAGVFDGSGVGVFSTVQALANGTADNFKVGDDVLIGDINVSNLMQVKGIQDGTKGFIQFGSGSAMPRIGGNGSNRLTMSNIPSYASNAAAISAGLAFGDIYRNGDNLCITHA